MDETTREQPRQPSAQQSSAADPAPLPAPADDAHAPPPPKWVYLRDAAIALGVLALPFVVVFVLIRGC